MEPYLLEWLNLLGRWAHLVVGIAWIGASFYFVWLDNHLQPPEMPEDVKKGVSGELWAVHGGGFYQAQKYKIAPEKLPDTLHWFKWEAYTTFITGAFLLALIYWYQAEIYLIDASVMSLSKPVAVAIGVFTIAGGWIIYDQLCKSKIGQKENVMAVVLLVVLSFAAWALCSVFSGRGAYMHFGAMLGTIMVANVYFIIMPGQRDLVAAKEQGRVPDTSHGIRAKQRSVHNTYFTLPVLFVMISNHYGMTHGHEYNWVILIVMSLIGALIRVHFVKAHFGKPSPVPLLVAVLLLIGLVFALAPTKPQSVQNSDGSSIKTATLTEVHTIIEARCASCHHDSPSHPSFAAAPAGIKFNDANSVDAQAQVIHQQSVVTRAMPIGNLTGMTEEERLKVASWYATKASAQ
ncbi:MAG: putative membrane protein [Granulosicoccus sp.]|jgi:uncharacterized membrane protein